MDRSGRDQHFLRKRLAMVESQIRARGVSDERVLAAMCKVPRHLFAGPGNEDQAYEDYPLPIGEGQTISQPYIVAEMTQALALGTGDRVLEIGTGSGYQAAVLSEIAGRVYTVERNPVLFERARKLFRQLGIESLETRLSDGTLGFPEEAPFDAVLVTAGSPSVPKALVAQLGPGGRLVIPVGDQYFQELIKLTRSEHGIRESRMGGVRFVKLIGEQGWRE
ncbi:MAG: protein-L-isoaspartate(D-aspartate) O-methyltransferase [Thermodesulfobacteriota bacterium]